MLSIRIFDQMAPELIFSLEQRKFQAYAEESVRTCVGELCTVQVVSHELIQHYRSTLRSMMLFPYNYLVAGILSVLFC